MLNVVCLMGRLGDNPELRHTQTQIPVTSFSIAVNRTFQPKGQEKQTDWINIVAWRSTAEFICKYFRKGSMIAVQGSLQSRNFTDKEGNKRTSYEVVADNVFFGESRREGGVPSGSYDSQIPQYNEAQPAFSTADSGDFEEIVGDDELPF
ncbi:MAG: single-stranded DNA-binding protein [Oscillospiraceae bacterium]|nr:single-stranded DNA-binding protein [Oscillospiraceae bacterium]MDD4414719.1 single-stranded DNA-binding protein [Oscillospiraceae bacterium]